MLDNSEPDLLINGNYTNLFKSNSVTHQIDKNIYLEELLYRVANFSGTFLPGNKNKEEGYHPFKQLLIASTNDRVSNIMSSNTMPIEKFSLMCQPQPGSISRHPVDVVLNNNIFSNILRKYPTKLYKFLCRICSIVMPTQINKLKDNQDPNIIIISVNGLRDAHEILVDDISIKSFGYINTNEIPNWNEIKKNDNQISLTFGYLSDSTTVHSSFPFEIHDTSDLKQFTISLISGKREVLSFPGAVNKTPIVILSIEIYKR